MMMNCDDVFSECPPGTHGQDCGQTCNCKDKTDCHPVTGDCICSPGWHGPGCDMSKSAQWQIFCSLTCTIEFPHHFIWLKTVTGSLCCFDATDTWICVCCITFQNATTTHTAPDVERRVDVPMEPHVITSLADALAQLAGGATGATSHVRLDSMASIAAVTAHVTMDLAATTWLANVCALLDGLAKDVDEPVELEHGDQTVMRSVDYCWIWASKLFFFYFSGTSASSRYCKYNSTKI